MKKIIKIDGSQPCELNSSLGWLFIYREEFGHDILPDLMPLIEALLGTVAKAIDDESDSDNILAHINGEVIEDALDTLYGLETTTVLNIIWALAKNSNPEIKGHFEWVNQFERIEMDKILVPVFELIVSSCVSPKNAKSLLKIKKAAKKIKEVIPSMTSSSPASTEG